MHQNSSETVNTDQGTKETPHTPLRWSNERDDDWLKGLLCDAFEWIQELQITYGGKIKRNVHHIATSCKVRMKSYYSINVIAHRDSSGVATCNIG